MDQDIRAIAKHIPISAQKTRLVVDLVRGKDVMEALEVLAYTPNKAAQPLTTLLRSAIANAENNFGMNRYDLYIHKVVAPCIIDFFMAIMLLLIIYN